MKQTQSKIYSLLLVLMSKYFGNILLAREFQTSFDKIEP